HRARLVVDAGIEAELLDDPLALRRAAGNADGPAALDLRELPDRLADGPRSAGDDDGLAGLRLAHVHEAEVRGHSRHAENIEPLRQRADAQVDLRERGLGQLPGTETRVLLNPERTRDAMADGELRARRHHDGADAAGAHDFADADRRDVALA